MNKEEVINEVIEDWMEEFITGLAAKREAEVGSDTGESKRSFDIERIKAAAGSAAVVTASFLEYSRYYDMRRVQREKGLDARGIERIKKWVERKGVQNFLKGYKYPTKVRKKGGAIVDVDTTRIINNIAWGISKRKRRLRRKQWYNKQKGSEVYDLYYRLVNAVAEVVAGDFLSS